MPDESHQLAIKRHGYVIVGDHLLVAVLPPEGTAMHVFSLTHQLNEWGQKGRDAPQRCATLNSSGPQ